MNVSYGLKVLLAIFVGCAILGSGACGDGKEAATVTPKLPAGKSPTAAMAATSAATAGVGATVIPTAALPTSASVPPTAAALPPTPTSVPQTATALPPTATSVPPSPTPVIPTATPIPPRNCDPAYPDVCIPPPPPDLDCGEIPYRRFRVLPPDPHGFDRDGDGIGCES